MSEVKETKNQNGKVNEMEQASASSIVSESQDVIDGVKEILDQYSRTCEAEITNQTEFVLTHSTMYAEHGTYGSIPELPSVAPLFKDKEGNQYEFPQAMGIEDISLFKGAAGAMVWEIVDAGLYLVVACYIHSHDTNQGYFELTESLVDAETWWNANNSKLVQCGSIGSNCNATVGNIEISGTMNSVDNAELKITIAPAS